ncbi:MAG TPA: SH3 domain-containing protein [Anaerolineales bacterium]|nr:SH3 domain-containing protein [Anaerolineales bacterium]
MKHIRFLLYSLFLITFTACQPADTTTTITPNTSIPGNSVPMLTVREATNCRAGPGTDYEIVFTYTAGTKLEIAGRYEPENFWLVKSAESPTGLCWMWGEYADVTGNYAAVPGVTPPATSSSASSEVLIVDQWEYSCDGGTLTFKMNWRDRATNETGYRIFRDGTLLAELPVDSTSYKDSFSVSAGQNVEYYLQVVGPDGLLNSAVMSANC